MAEPIKYEFVAVDKNLTATIENIDKTLLNMDANLLKVSKSMDSIFSGMTRNVKASAAEVDSLAKKLASLSTSKLITFSPKNINEANAAIQELTKRRNELDRTDKNYLTTLSQINNRQATLTAQTRQATTAGLQNANAIRQTTNAYNGQIAVVSQLRNQMAGLFSIYGAQRFLQQMVKVRGEFELQSVALTAMLQDRQLADQLFGQVQELALKSPFKILELNSYLKQLKAYRIENEELVGTLKNLGDISAGLGVDMSRLILAYGQVKAASVLRGQELRQFTEAGIPLVGQLADKFTELEGRVVSTEEVFDKISKRQVSFEMIRDIFGEMTSEGGIFFNQQEIQAETLSGQVSILADAWSKMLNELGKANEGGLKGTIGIARSLIDNYETVLDVIKALITTYGAYRTALIVTNLLEKDKALLLSKVAKAQAFLNKTITKNPYVLAATAITAVITALIAFSRAQKRANDEFLIFNNINQDVTANLKQQTIGSKLLIEQLKATEKGSARRNELIQKANKEYPELLRNIDAETASLNELQRAFNSYASELEKAIRIDVISDNIKSQITEISNLTKKLQEEQSKLAQGQNEAAINLSLRGGVIGQAVGRGRLDQLGDEIRLNEQKLKLLENELNYQTSINEEGKQIADVRKSLLEVDDKITILEKTKTLYISEINSTTGELIINKQKELEYTQALNEELQRRNKLENDLRRLLEGEGDVEIPKWIEALRKITEESKATEKFDFTPKTNVKYQEYVDSLRDSYARIKKEIDDIKNADDDRHPELLLRSKELKLQFQLIKDQARYLGIILETERKRGGFKLTNTEKLRNDQLKDQLRLLKELRDARELLDKASDKRFLLQPEEKAGFEQIFDKEEFKKAFSDLGLDTAIFESFSDETYQTVLDAFLEKYTNFTDDLAASGRKGGKEFASGLLKSMTQEIESESTKNPLDILQKSLEEGLDIIKLREKLLGTFAPFGEGFVFDVTLITTKAEDDIQKVIDKYTKAQRGANEDQIKVLEELKNRELEGIREVRDARIESLVAGSVKKELGSLEQFYTNINEATLRQIKLVDSEIAKISDRKIEPIELISPELPETLGLAKDEIENILIAIKENLTDDVTLKDTFGLTDEQLNRLKDIVKESEVWNEELGDIVEKWIKLSDDEKIKKIGKNISDISSSVSELSNELGLLAEAFDIPEISDFAERISFASEQIGIASQAGASFATEDIAGGISSSLNLISNEIQDISSQISEAKKVSDDWDKITKDIAHNYALINIESKLSRQNTEDIFGLEDTIKIASDAFDAYRLAREELNRLSDDLDSGKIQTGVEKVYNPEFSIFGGIASIVKTVITPELEPVFQSLEERFGQVFDPETFEINPEILAQYDALDENTRELVDNWQETVDLMNDAKNQMLDILEDLTGTIGTDFSDSIVDSFINGTDAAEEWGESVEDIIENILEGALKTAFLKPIFDDLLSELENTVAKSASPEDVALDIAKVFDSGEIEDAIDLYKTGLSEFQDQFKEFGLNLWEDTVDEAKGLSRGIQAVTEDTANIIAAYLNTIRHEVILQSGYLTQLINLAKQSQAAQSGHLSELIKIRDNTAGMLRILEDVVAGSKTLKVA